MKQDEYETQRRIDSICIGLYRVDGIYVCLQSHYTKLTFSIYTFGSNENVVIKKDGVTFIVDSDIDEEKANSVINMILEEIDKEE